MWKKIDSCIFNNNWLSDTRFSSWLAKSSPKWRATCTICCKDFDISNMGVSALSSHAAGKKHRDMVVNKESCASSFFEPKRSESHNRAAAGEKTPTITSMLVSSSISRAEILWVLKVVMSHYFI